jgi:Delta3-Delta2-enoyl-CoA isomerase
MFGETRGAVNEDAGGAGLAYSRVMHLLIRHDAVVEIHLDRPPANALDPASVRWLAAQLKDPPDGARALVLSGLPKMFSTGLDVPVLQTLSRAELSRFWVEFFGLLRAFAACRLPIAAAVTGHAPAGGTVMAAFCDYRVMAQGGFKLGFNEVRVGLPLPYPIYVCFARVCGVRLAGRFGMEGKILTGEEGLGIGLVDELAPLEEVVTRALAWAQGVAALPPHAVQTTRSYHNRALVQAFDEDAANPDAMSSVWFSDETQAAMARLMQQIKK